MDKVVNIVIWMVATTTLLNLTEVSSSNSSCSINFIENAPDKPQPQCTVEINCRNAIDDNIIRNIEESKCAKDHGNKYEVKFKATEIVSESNFITLEKDFLKRILTASITDSKEIEKIPYNFYLFEKVNKIEITGSGITKVNLQKFCTLPDIKNISLSDNAIDFLEQEEEFGGNDKTKLEYINLSKNKIRTIPKQYFTHFKLLTNLDLSNNIISNISISSFQGLDQLQKLNLSHNVLTDVGTALHRFQNLETLILDYNKINYLTNHSFEVLIQLKKLDLSHNELDEIDENTFYELRKLEELNLSNNKITKILPKTFNENKHLKTLILTDNSITNMGQETFALNQISNFQINGNSLPTCSKLSKGLKITKYDLSNQRLSIFEPSCVDGLEVSILKELNLRNNSITDIKKGSFVGMSNLEILDLSENNIIKIQFETNDLTSLRTFNVQNNKIKDIDREIFRNINGLENLDLSNNEISDLDKTIFEELRELKIIKLNNNPIKNAIESNEFKNCDKVTKLDLSHTKVNNFNENAFSGMKNLQHLIAPSCKISSVHNKTFGNTGSIKSLDLSDNLLNNFFVDPEDLTNLTHLNLSHNSIEILDQHSLNFAKLEDLDLSYNKIKLIEAEYFASFRASIRDINLSFNEQLVIKPNTFKGFELKTLILKGIQSINFEKSKIEFLDVSSCKIDKISDLSLNKVSDIKVIDLSDNNIDSFNQESLKELSTLRSVDLSGNSIKQLPTNSFENNVLLETIKINNNNLEEIAYKAFYGLQYLKTLELSNNNLSNFEVSRLPILVRQKISLSLANNSIHQISFEDFKETVKVLNIDNNPIACEEIQHAKTKNTFTIKPEYIEKFCLKPTTIIPEKLVTEIISKVKTTDQTFIDTKINMQNQELESFIINQHNNTIKLILEETKKRPSYEKIEDTIQKQHKNTSDLFINMFNQFKNEKAPTTGVPVGNQSKASNNNNNALVWVTAVCSGAVFIIIIAKLSHSFIKSRNQK